MIMAVILAAGEARRMGEVKQLLDWQGEPLICQVIRKVTASRFASVRLVLGAYYQQIVPWVTSLVKELELDLDLEVVYNPDYQMGQSTSVQRGLTDLPDQVQGVAFILADQPLVQVETYNMLIDYFNQEKPGILIPTYQGQFGNPKFFHRKFFSELCNVMGDQGGRAIIRQYSEQVHQVEVADPGVLSDIDYPEDYARLKFKE